MSSNLDIHELRERFRKYNCLGVVSLINFLASPEAEGLYEIGSASIDFWGAIANAKSVEERLEALLFKTQKFYLGSPSGSPSPLESIAGIANVFDDLSQEVRDPFDRICGEFATIVTARPVGIVKSYSRDGLRTMGVDEYTAEKNAELNKKIN